MYIVNLGRIIPLTCNPADREDSNTLLSVSSLAIIEVLLVAKTYNRSKWRFYCFHSRNLHPVLSCLIYPDCALLLFDVLRLPANLWLKTLNRRMQTRTNNLLHEFGLSNNCRFILYSISRLFSVKNAEEA